MDEYNRVIQHHPYQMFNVANYETNSNNVNYFSCAQY